MRDHHRFALVFIVANLCFNVCVFAAGYTIDSQVAQIDSEQIISLGAFSSAGSEPSVQVVSSDDSELTLAFELPALNAVPVTVGEELFHGLSIDGGGFRGAPGAPMLPTFTRFIEIPATCGATIEVAAVEAVTLTEYRPLPVQNEDSTDFTFNQEAYDSARFTDTALSEIGEPAIMRGVRVVPITFCPVRYNGADNRLEAIREMRVVVRFTGSDPRNSAPREHRIVPPSFARMYENLIINYSGPRSDQIVGLGTYVIICPNNSTVVSLLQPLVEWRSRKGFDVVLATTAETGTSTSLIKAWIQEKYDTLENPPEYITLVGDADGTISIPTWWVNGGEGDVEYTRLEGGDILPDAHVGRISVSTTSQLELYVHKIVSYESTPYMTDTEWYTRGCVIGDPSSSGWTTVQCMQWLKSKLVDHAYTEVDTVFSGSFLSQMITKMNRGDTVVGYRGYWHMSGMDTGHIANLQNGRKMPYAVILTCDTGSFANGTSRSEAFMRAGAPPSTPTAGIASIGTATLSTHTRFNNCITYGIWHSIFEEDNFSFGASLTRGKYELYLNYWANDAYDVQSFSQWNNLMGDPGGEIWTGVPAAMYLAYDGTIPVGASSMTMRVNSDHGDLEGAYVCLWKENDDFHSGGYTGADGRVEIPLTDLTTGQMLVTVTKHDYLPHLGSTTVSTIDQFIGFEAYTLDGDGLLNPAETAELQVQVKNYSFTPVTNVTGLLSCDDPLISIIDDTEDFGTVAGGALAWCLDGFDIEIAPGTPDDHLFRLSLDLSGDSGNWHSLIEIPVTAAAFEFNSYTVTGAGTIIDPGESGIVSVSITNGGGASGTTVSGRLISISPWVTIDDNQGSFGTIGIGGNGENLGDTFSVSAENECYPGHLAKMKLALQFSGGAVDTVNFSMQIGITSSTDPSGPDAYGYYAYDNTDTAYPEAPIYNWIEISPSYGGAGSDVGLSDFGSWQDDSRTIELPFEFTYYGEPFTHTTICSNGWMTMGHTNLTNYRNWQIPAAGAPPNLIAPMWDNFYQSSSNRVCQYFDASNHRYIVEWCYVLNMYPSSHPTSNFQVILYDPDYYPTETGDGIIDFQYKQYNNSDSQQMYSTTGIQNADYTDGICYSYFADYYDDGSAPITTERAIRFQAKRNFARGILAGRVTNSSMGGTSVGGATVTLVETGETYTTNAGGLYEGTARADVYTVMFTHPSFETMIVSNVSLLSGEVTELNAGLADIAGPAYSNTTQLPSTGDTTGPYSLSSTITEYSYLAELTLHYNLGGAGWTSVQMLPEAGDLYSAEIPGAPYTTQVAYYIYGRDLVGNESYEPANGIYEPLRFWVIEPLVNDDLESGAGDWSHQVVTGGFGDQWHVSTEMDHSVPGTTAWKFGDTGGGNYGNLSDGALISAPITLDSDATLTFWHWISSEVTSSPGYAYDGGRLEISVNGGNWQPITPEGGYPFEIEGTGSPFPVGTAVYSGFMDWSRAEFRIEGIRGVVQLRFRFGSNSSGTAEGWYIDDIYLLPDSPGMAASPEHSALPAQMTLNQNRPNPLRGGATVIQFYLPESGDVQLNVFDPNGRLVKSLINGGKTAGNHQIQWNGLDSHNQVTASGIYFYSLRLGTEQIGRRMVIMR